MVKTVITLHPRHILKSYSNLHLCTSFWDTLMPLIILEMAEGCEQIRLAVAVNHWMYNILTYLLWVTKREYESSLCLGSTQCPLHSHPIYSRHLEQRVATVKQKCKVRVRVRFRWQGESNTCTHGAHLLTNVVKLDFELERQRWRQGSEQGSDDWSLLELTAESSLL